MAATRLPASWMNALDPAAGARRSRWTAAPAGAPRCPDISRRSRPTSGQTVTVPSSCRRGELPRRLRAPFARNVIPGAHAADRARNSFRGVYPYATVQGLMMGAKTSLLSRFASSRSDAERAATRTVVSGGAAITGPYLAMNACATLLAGFGLLQNSPAVIIGAMLVAMLFGPLMGIALGLAEADMLLLARSIVSEIVGAVLVLTIAYALGMASRNLSIGSEILSRTSPTVIDLLIGLVGGLAGGFTYLSTGLAGVIVGVAISIALVPPLTSCGILLARHVPGLAAGAFLLFLTNFTAIVVGAMVIFWLIGHRSTAAGRPSRVL